MKSARDRLWKVFEELNERIKTLNCGRRSDGLFMYPKSEITLLGQMSLLANEKVAAALSLAQTADLDAHLKMEHEVKEELKKILSSEGLVYDEDSHLIWIPKDAAFNEVFGFSNLIVNAIDAESALVSKAVKAPGKNKQLIREAIASGKFSKLADRIIASGGKLENFV